MKLEFDCILAFGDSFVSGCELIEDMPPSEMLKEYNSFVEIDYFTKKLSFPQLLGERIGLPVYNYAMSGGSNSRSIRTLFNALSIHRNALILFGYTTCNRWEFYDHGLPVGKFKYVNQSDDNFVQATIHLDGKFKNSCIHPGTKNFLKYCGDAYHDISQTMFFVESAALATNSTCIHLILFPDYDNNLSFHPKHLFDFQGEKNFIDWGNAKKFKILPWGHFEQDAHVDLAKLLFDYVENIE